MSRIATTGTFTYHQSWLEPPNAELHVSGTKCKFEWRFEKSPFTSLLDKMRRLFVDHNNQPFSLKALPNGLLGISQFQTGQHSGQGCQNN